MDKVSQHGLSRLTWVDTFCKYINSLPNNKFLDRSKLKAFADNKLNLPEKIEICLGKVENIVGKGENAGDQHFLLFPQYFQRFDFGYLKVVIVWERVKPPPFNRP